MPPRRRLPSAPMVCAPLLAALAAVSPALAQTPDAATLAKTVSEQAETIRRLEARLNQLEARLAPPPAPAKPAIIELPAPPPKVEPIRWNSGGSPDFYSPDGRLVFRTRGRLAFDVSSTRGSAFAARNITGTEARVMRLGAEGNLSPNLNYMLEADFADNGVTMKSVYIGWDDVILGHDVDFSFGNRLMDRTMEGGSAIDAAPFPERNPVSYLVPQKGFIGMGLTGKVFGEGWHATVQVAGEDITNPGDNRDSLVISTRAHWNPLLTPTKTIHLGVWAFHETLPTPEPTVTRTLRMGINFNDQVQMTSGPVPSIDGSDAFGVEAGGVSGPFWGFLEAGRRRLDSLAVGKVDFDAQALSAGWYLTGDRSNYTPRTGTFSRYRVRRPLSAGGPGAWELLGRIDHADFTDAPVGGMSDTASLAINWYPEVTSRFTLYWSHWKMENRTGPYVGHDAGDTFAARALVSF